jgi:hypothetical protein
MNKSTVTWKLFYEDQKGEIRVGFVEETMSDRARIVFNANNPLTCTGIIACSSTGKIMTPAEISEEIDAFHYRTPII